MSDTQTNDSTDTETDGGDWRRNLEAQLKDANERASKAEKANAFRSVKGLDIEGNPQHKYFAETYNGKYDVDEITKRAIESGFIKDEAATQAAQTGAEQAQLDAASSNAAPADIQGSDEQKLNAILNGNYNSLAEYEAAVKEAGFAKNLLNG